MRLQPGTYLQGDKYRIVEVLGQGGFGITYLAEQELVDRKVCIKEFFPKDYYNRNDDMLSISLGSQGSAEIMERFKEKFIKEAKTISRLNHAHIIHILDIFKENNTCYYVMEYIDGESLSNMVKRGGALSESLAVGYVRQIAEALSYIHGRNVMHLDVKPANIMVSREDDSVILIDFGLSKHYDAESGEATSTTPVGVSHGFAPMEQYKPGGVREFSPQTDIYSLGATLYYLVTGSVPPLAADIADEGLPELPATLSAGVRRAIEGAMEVQRRHRPRNVAEFLALLGGDDEANVVVTPILDNEATRIMVDDITPNHNNAKYHVGDFYDENGKMGVIFEVSEDGLHGKIVSVQQSEQKWYKAGFFGVTMAVGANDNSDGRSNTAMVMARGERDKYMAVAWCSRIGNQWYLPAVEELKTILANRDVINATLAKYNSPSLYGTYWSSTEHGDSSAWNVTMYDGFTRRSDKEASLYVRAVTTF